MSAAVFVSVFFVALSAGFILFKNYTALLDTARKFRLKEEYSISYYSPLVSIVVPVYNEGASDLRKCLVSCLDNDYYNKEVVVVNDGSTNDSLETCYSVQKDYPQLKIIDLVVNRGKRHAMHAGIMSTTGSIIVNVDSDSIIQSGESIRAITRPFIAERVHAVSGNTLATNEKKNLLTRMQSARYALAFEVEKAGQSFYSCVTCCPGCYSAYRRSAVLPVLDKWLSHSVFGVKTSYGDDRSLTRMILLNGGEVTYVSEALCGTNVPETVKVFVMQQVRWKRSFASEHFLLAMGWNKLKTIARIELVWFVTVFLLGYFAKGVVIYSAITGSMHWFDALVLYASFSVVHYIYVFVRYPGSKGFFGALYGLLNDLSVEWLFWYSVATLRNNKWGTR